MPPVSALLCRSLHRSRHPIGYEQHHPTLGLPLEGGYEYHIRLPSHHQDHKPWTMAHKVVIINRIVAGCHNMTKTPDDAKTFQQSM